MNEFKHVIMSKDSLYQYMCSRQSVSGVTSAELAEETNCDVHLITRFCQVLEGELRISAIGKRWHILIEDEVETESVNRITFKGISTLAAKVSTLDVRALVAYIITAVQKQEELEQVAAGAIVDHGYTVGQWEKHEEIINICTDELVRRSQK